MKTLTHVLGVFTVLIAMSAYMDFDGIFISIIVFLSTLLISFNTIGGSFLMLFLLKSLKTVELFKISKDVLGLKIINNDSIDIAELDCSIRPSESDIIVLLLSIVTIWWLLVNSKISLAIFLIIMGVVYSLITLWTYFVTRTILDRMEDRDES